MTENFHERFVSHEPPLPSDRSTGLTFAVVALVVAYLSRANATVAMLGLTCAAGFGLVALVAPKLIRPLNVAWMRLSLLSSKVATPIVMLILFVIVIIPAGLVFQLRHDPLRRRRSDGDSYWINRPSSAVSNMTNSF